MTLPTKTLRRGPAAFILYLLFVAVYLGAQMFQGFSWLDIGMYMSGYRHFTSDPYASYFLGQWILTYDLTSSLCRIFSIDSFMGLRILHLVYVLVMQTAVYLFLRRRIPHEYIIGGLLVATLAHFGAYTEINYNEYSALLLTLSIMSLHAGASGNRPWLVVAAGMAAGIAVFFRIVNITYIGLPLLSCLVSLRWRLQMSPLRRILLFYAGMAAGAGIVVVILWRQGLLGILQLTISDIAGISADKGDTHGMLYVMRSMYNLYSEVLANCAYLVLLSLMLYKSRSIANRLLRRLLTSLTFVLTLVMMNFSFFPSNITMAICLLGCVPLFFGWGKASGKFSHLYIMSLYLPLVFPVGSNAEPSFYGKELCFLTLPLALYELLDVVALREIRRIPTATGMPYPVFAWMRDRYRKPMVWLLAMISAGFVFFNATHKQMEDGNRIASHYTIDTELTRGILTTADNARTYNYLMKELHPVVRPGSYMICSFSLPMVSLLECRPWAVYSTVYSTDSMNSRYIRVAWQHTRRLPYLLLDKECPLAGYGHILKELSRIRPYRMVWTDGRYQLYCPEGNNL